MALTLIQIDMMQILCPPEKSQACLTFTTVPNMLRTTCLQSSSMGTKWRTTFDMREKEQVLEQIGRLSTGARAYCQNIDQHLLFSCDAQYPKYDVYTNQPTECLNWVFRPARKKTRLLLLKSIEAWFLKQLAERKRARVHTERLLASNMLTDYCHRQLTYSVTQFSWKAH